MVSRVSSFDSATVGSGALVNEVVVTYNSFGQLTNDQQSHAGAVSGSTAQVQYAYANGSANTIRQNTLTYPNGRVLNMNYGTASSMSDALSRVAALVDTNGTTQLSTYSYLGMAAPVEVPYPVPNLRYTLIGTAGGNDPDTGDIYYGLDRFGRIKDLTWRNFTTATNVVRLLHGYDRAGNRLFRKDLAANAAGQRFDELYTYDGSYRLAFMRRGTLNATNTAIAGGTLRAQQCFTLDSTGNWLGFRRQATDAADRSGRMQAEGGSPFTSGTWDLVQTRTANTVNEITDITNTTGAAWVDPVYNTVGNMTTLPQPADPTKSYAATYDAWNRLVRLADDANTVADYAYDGRKFRIVSRSYTAGVLSETRHHYYTAGWQCVEERLGTSPDSASADLQYVWGPRYVDDLVLRDKSSERLFAMQDANWNVVAIADASAVVQERYAYSPYGVPVFLTPTFTSRATSSFTWQRLFTGQTFDTPTGLHHFRNRMLHSQVGTFITRDPIGYADGLHLYRAYFVLGRIDPAGLQQGIIQVLCKDGSVITVRADSDRRFWCANNGGLAQEHGEPPQNPPPKQFMPQPGGPERNRKDPTPAPPSWDGYGWYCGLGRYAIRNETVAENVARHHPIDFLDWSCLRHDLCLKTASRFLDPRRQFCCNIDFCCDTLLGLARGGCQSSPDPEQCVVYAQKIMLSHFCWGMDYSRCFGLKRRVINLGCSLFKKCDSPEGD